jgi:hypothetical protein
MSSTTQHSTSDLLDLAKRFVAAAQAAAQLLAAA